MSRRKKPHLIAAAAVVETALASCSRLSEAERRVVDIFVVAYSTIKAQAEDDYYIVESGALTLASFTHYVVLRDVIDACHRRRTG
jgi:hypothetical protein